MSTIVDVLEREWVMEDTCSRGVSTSIKGAPSPNRKQICKHQLSQACIGLPAVYLMASPQPPKTDH